jgi:hypothetical protein
MTISANVNWRVRVGGSNANGGGFDASISGAGTDYSQQDAAQLSLTDIACSNTPTVTSAVGGFTAAMIGNAMWLAGGGATAGAYFITAVASLNSITVDRSPGTISAGSGKVGGAWADPRTNITAQSLKNGNTIYIRGAGNPASTPDYTVALIDFTSNGAESGSFTAGGLCRFIGEAGAMPHIRCSAGSFTYQTAYAGYENLYMSAGAGSSIGMLQPSAYARDCVCDQRDFDVPGISVGGNATAWGCEVFSSTVTTAGTYAGIVCPGYGQQVVNCYVHDCKAHGVSLSHSAGVWFSVFARNKLDGILYAGGNPDMAGKAVGCTVDGNLRHGVNIPAGAIGQMNVVNCLITNHVTASTYGIYLNGSGTLALNDKARKIFGCAYYGNTTNADLMTIADGLNADIILTGDPYINQANSDYSINPTLRAMALPRRAWTSSKAGQTAFRSYMDLGAIQRQEPASIASGGGALIL